MSSTEGIPESTKQCLDSYIAKATKEIHAELEEEYSQLAGTKDFIPSFLGLDDYECWAMMWMIDHCEKRDRNGDLSPSDTLDFPCMSDEVHRLAKPPRNEDGTSKRSSRGDMGRVRYVQRSFVNGLMARIIMIQLLGSIRYLEMMQQKAEDVVFEKMKMLLGLLKGVGPFLFETKSLVPIVEMMIEKIKEQRTMPGEKEAGHIKPFGVSSEEKYDPKWEDAVRMERKTWGYNSHGYVDELRSRLHLISSTLGEKGQVVKGEVTALNVKAAVLKGAKLADRVERSLPSKRRS
ncbi:hypothetical protein BKA64DRAFT_636964 [Cadophora sp. MPI-SDFR-AT-0126]|nr:hypothetical protein BKA64DRAFT_636964 [Leotiomycetes sp. MPI-SDFR-AT-0126]